MEVSEIEMPIVFGLSSALMFGLLDILITQATRTLGMMYTLVIAHATAAGVILLYLLVVHTTISATSLPLLICIGVGIGVVSCLTNLSLYKGLALGPLALISPVIASYGLITMFLAVIFLHQLPSLLVLAVLLLIVVGMLLATSTSGKEKLAHEGFSLPLVTRVMAGVALGLTLITTIVLFILLRWLELDTWLVLFCCCCEAICMFLSCCLALSPSLARMHAWWASNQQQSGLLFGVGAMLGFGVEYFLLSIATVHLGPIQPVLISRTCSSLLLFAYARQQHVRGWGEIKLKQFSLVLLIGVCDIMGTIFYDIGSRQNTLLVAALSSTYPLFPFLVGVLWYRERVRLAQWGGVCVMIFGTVGLSLIGK